MNSSAAPGAAHLILLLSYFWHAQEREASNARRQPPDTRTVPGQRNTHRTRGSASMSRDILSGLPDATRGEILSFMTFFKGERARTLEALDGDFEDCLEDRIRGVDPPFSLEDVTSAVDHLQVVVCVETS